MWLAARPFLVDVFRLVVWLVLLVVVFVPLERLFPLRPMRFWRKQMGVDLAWFFVNGIVPPAIIAFPLAVLARALQGADPGGLYSTIAAWPLWMKLPLALLVSDFGSYWAHRALHANRVLWRFHAIHHSAEHVDWLVNSRAHPLDIVILRLAGLIPLYLVGLAQAMARGLDPVVLMVAIGGTAWTYLIHANLRVRLGPLEWLVSTPAFHHWHHTNDEHRDRNFAAIFPVFDHAFGTAWLPTSWPSVYGIASKVPATFSGQLLDPLAPVEPA